MVASEILDVRVGGWMRYGDELEPPSSRGYTSNLKLTTYCGEERKPLITIVGVSVSDNEFKINHEPEVLLTLFGMKFEAAMMAALASERRWREEHGV